MTPVMARCACPEAFPIAECTACAPPALFRPVTPPHDDPFGFLVDDEEPPPVTVTIAFAGAALTTVAVIGAVAVTAWTVGAVIGALRGVQ